MCPRGTINYESCFDASPPPKKKPCVLIIPPSLVSPSSLIHFPVMRADHRSFQRPEHHTSRPFKSVRNLKGDWGRIAKLCADDTTTPPPFPCVNKSLSLFVRAPRSIGAQSLFLPMYCYTRYHQFYMIAGRYVEFQVQCRSRSIQDLRARAVGSQRRWRVTIPILVLVQ